MEKTTHLFENNVYYISNKSVALNGMFVDSSMQLYFIEKMEYYLSPICKLVAYDLSDNSFQILVNLKDRKSFEAHFLSKNRKKKKKEIAILDIPDSTYIFSQAMANLQVSFVKHFNYTFQRSGTLMASRYFRQLVENEEEMQSWIQKLNNGTKVTGYSAKWMHQMQKSSLEVNSRWLYEKVERAVVRVHELYCVADKIDLVSVFNNLPPKALSSSKNFYTNKFNLLFGP